MALTHVQLRDAIVKTTSHAFGGTIRLPAGEFDCADTIEVPAISGITFLGDGAGRTIIRNVGPNPLFRLLGGKFNLFQKFSHLKLEGEIGSGHLIEPDVDTGSSNFVMDNVWAHQKEPNSSVWHQAITERGTFFVAFRDCRLECGAILIRSNVPAIDIEGVDNSFASVWFTNIRFQCNHSKVPFFRVTNSSRGNPLKQVVIRDCAIEQCQNGFLQLQGSEGFTMDSFTVYDTVSPFSGHYIEFQTGEGGFANEGAIIRGYTRTSGHLGALAGTLFTVTSLSQTGGTATCTTSSAHGYATGDQVEIDGTVPATYEGLKTITVTGATTFTFTINSGAASPATPGDGGITARRMQRAISSMTRSSTTATCNTVQDHDLEVGQRAFIDGADQDEYNGMQTVLSVVDANSFTFEVDSGATTPATGTMWAGIGAQDILLGPDDIRSVLENTIGIADKAEVDINDTSTLILGRHSGVTYSRIPENTSTVLSMGSGASLDTKIVRTDSIEARTAGGQITVTDEIAALSGVEFGGNASITDVRVASEDIDFASVPGAGGTQTADITISGIGTTWRAVVNPQSNVDNGLVLTWRTITDGVRLKLTNATALAIDPGSISFLVTVWKH